MTTTIDDGSPARRNATPGPERGGGPTLAEVAQAAGVSRATASRVLAGRAAGKSASHARVLAAAEELGYVVNGLARSMMGVGRRSIAFVSSIMVGPTFASMAGGAEDVATANGHLFTMCTTGGDVEREAALIETLSEQRVAAVLLVGSTPATEEFEARAQRYSATLARVGAQLILCGRAALPHHPHIASIDYDHRGGVRTGVEHLVTLGHRRIAFLGSLDDMTTPHQRFLGYQDGLHDAGIAFDPALAVRSSNTSDDAAAATLDLLGRDPDVTAIVCQTDIMAVGVCRALHAEGIAIPERISVVGFDDMQLVADLTPSLTTVRAPFHDVGELAGRIAVGGAYDGPVVLAGELIVRGSTGPVRSD
ncbi:LacI family DNA-binding transcriptional regulator [Microbacterium sp. LMC-P-041]|uniref:LacI family DNA-binding transcriptional regulator n=1 Tax=Microbacterium sp. LMC-P-041 TaxID=3040293 RepID=UPI0025557589|nr:LacI family DNA-binding transcriptional regulator [Microbacterium sp. LMC-P-041]